MDPNLHIWDHIPAFLRASYSCIKSFFPLLKACLFLLANLIPSLELPHFTGLWMTDKKQKDYKKSSS